MRILSLMLAIVISQTLVADPKEDFVKAAMTQCKVSKEKAEELATSGRTGSIVQYSLCVSSNVEAADNCKVTCKKQGSNIGG